MPTQSHDQGNSVRYILGTLDWITGGVFLEEAQSLFLEAMNALIFSNQSLLIAILPCRS